MTIFESLHLGNMKQRLTTFLPFRIVLFIAFIYLGSIGYAQTYCNVGVTSVVEPITLVEFAGINNPTANTGTPGYQDFTSIVGNVTAGSSYTMILKGNTVGNNTCYFRVYIDWNGDGDFHDANESIDVGTIVNSSGTDSKTVTKNIIVPSCDVAPSVRMRIVKNYASYDLGSCASVSYGQIEDYTLNISNPGGMTAYTVTGGNPDMPNASVGLSGSTVGVSYQLLQNGTPVGSPIIGTGSAISFGNQTAGIYTVEASETGGCTKTMLGNAVVAVVIFDFTGGDQTYTIPPCATKIRAYMWGAGGAGGDAVKSNTTLGGGGGYVTGDISVTPGENLTLIVGEGGRFRSDLYATTYGGGGRGGYDGPYTGNGGGRSAIRRGATELATAGAGGSGGETRGNGTDLGGYGGPGGGLTGGDGYKAGTTLGNFGGKGGTQTGGGAAGTGGNQQAPTAGSQFLGGNGGKQTSSSTNIREGGGGGGGYYGGGGGVASSAQGGGGGGGSSYIGGMTNATTIIGHATNGNAGNQSSKYNMGQYGVGGQTNASGLNGRIVLEIIEVDITPPTVGVIVQPTCLNSTASVTLENLPSTGNWTITQNPDLTTISGSGTSYTITGLTPGMTYNWSITNSAGCTSDNSANVSINSVPTINQPTINTVVATCTSPSSQTITNHDNSYSYSFTPAGPSIDANGVIASTSFGNYTVTATYGACTSASDQFIISDQLPSPDQPIITSQSATCTSPGTNQIQNYSSAFTYIFTPSGPSVNSNGGILNMQIGTNYTVVASDGACSSIASEQFHQEAILQAPETPMLSMIPATCESPGQGVITNYDANYDYSFTPPGPVVGNNGILQNISYGVNYVVISQIGNCASDPSMSFVVEPQLAAPHLVVSQEATICEGESVSLSVTGADGYSWKPVNGLNITTGSNVIASPSETMTYTVIGTNGSGCVDSTTVKVNVLKIPTANFSASITEGDPVLDVTFTNQSLNATNYVWNFGNGSTSSSNSATVNSSYSEPGVYTVVLVAQNSTCVDESTLTITVFDTPKVTIVAPNVFTPNGDGNNDEWSITVQNAASISVDILNRWGVPIIRLDSFDDKWDGANASDGIYYYKYTVEDLKGEKHQGAGFFHLLR